MKQLMLALILSALAAMHQLLAAKLTVSYQFSSSVPVHDSITTFSVLVRLVNILTLIHCADKNETEI